MKFVYLALCAGSMVFFLAGISSGQEKLSTLDTAGPNREALAARQAGDSFSKQGDIQKAVEAYEQALRAYPDYADVYYLLGLIYDLQQGNLEKAIACYQKFLELAPNATEARDVRLLLESAQQATSSPSPTAQPPSISQTLPASVPPSSSQSAPAPQPPSTPPSPAPPIQPVKTPDTERKDSDNIGRTTEAELKTADKIITGDKAMKSDDVYKKDDTRKTAKMVDIQEIDARVKQKPSQSGKVRHPSEFAPSEQFVSRTINERVLKYTIKLAVWQREGFIQKFNELALARGSSLTNNIAEARAKLREERQKITDFIDYPKEAETILLRQLVNDFMKEWGIDLPQLPQKVDIQRAVPSIQVLSIEEDKKYVRLSLEARIDVQNLKEQLTKLGYQFTPARVQLQCSNLYGEFKDRFFAAIQRKSEYIKSQSEGLYEVYVPAELLASELSKMVIGTYGIRLDSVGKDVITFTAEPVEKGVQ
ncbi:MAG: tetratricopeptide repeat protein [bacterium]